MDKTQEALFQAMCSGIQMVSAEAELCELRLADSPDDWDVRGKLVGYYQEHIGCCVSARERRIPHILWVIQHFPECEIQFSCFIEVFDSDDHYYQVINMWKDQVAKYPGNPHVLANTAHQLMFRDMDGAEQLILVCQKLEPNKSAWKNALTNLRELKKKGFHYPPDLPVAERTCFLLAASTVNEMLAEIERNNEIEVQTITEFSEVVNKIASDREFFFAHRFLRYQAAKEAWSTKKLCKAALADARKEYKKRDPVIMMLERDSIDRLWGQLVFIPEFEP